MALARERAGAGEKASAALRGLLRARRRRGAEAAERKLALLRELERARLPRPEEVRRLHDALCFLRAYPDDPAVHTAVEGMLTAFGSRRDLHRHRAALADTGIAGTALHYDFCWFTADWLATRWPGRLTVDWEAFDTHERLDALLYSILQEHERLAYEGTTRTLPELVDVLRAPEETDAEYLLGCFRGLSMDPLVLEHLYEDIGPPLRLDAGPDTPSRTRAVFPAPSAFRTAPPDRARGSVRRRIGRDPVRVRRVSPRDGRRLVELGRSSLITRGRDLFAFVHADPGDAFVVDFGDGLQYACLGLPPERRHVLYTQYVLLVLQNGVPVGYVQACVLFDSAEVNFNVFDEYRGTEASRIFTSSLAAVRHLFAVDAFTINSHQLGDGNPEALKTGAWWFYYKHGFRPRHADVRDVVRRELRARRRDPTHRSSIATLEELSARELYLFLGRKRSDVIGRIDPAEIGASIARRVGERFGVSGQQAARVSSDEAARLLGPRGRDSWSRGERLAWKRWGPLVAALSGIERWSSAERNALVRVIRSKGGRSERDYALLFREHGRLRRGILELAG